MPNRVITLLVGLFRPLCAAGSSGAFLPEPLQGLLGLWRSADLLDWGVGERR